MQNSTCLRRYTNRICKWQNNNIVSSIFIVNLSAVRSGMLEDAFCCWQITKWSNNLAEIDHQWHNSCNNCTNESILQQKETSRSEISKMSLCFVLLNMITICDGKAYFAEKLFTVFKVQVHHYMSLAHFWMIVGNIFLPKFVKMFTFCTEYFKLSSKC